MGKRFAIVIGVAAAGVMALGAQTATSSTVGPVDSVPPEPPALEYKQKLGKAVKVKASCGDALEACTARAEGKLFWFTHVPSCGHDCVTSFKQRKLKPASADLGPGETTTLKLKLTKKTRKRAGEALDEGKTDTPRGPGRWKVGAQVIVDVGAFWPTEHNIRLVK